jgi:succinyl-diaminopimelate desuccinylase
VRISGEAFLTPRGAFTEIVSSAVAEVSGTMPTLSTSGGTSDARFIKDICPVVEFGLVGRTMHKVDECVSISDLEMLSDVYLSVLERYFLKTNK